MRETVATRGDLAAAQRAYQAALASEEGWQRAVLLCRRLSNGKPPPTMAVTSPEGEPVFLNARLECFSWYATPTIAQQRPVAAFGSPLFVAAAVALGDAANRRARQRAAAMALPRWHSHGQVQVLVTAAATWCGRGDQWRCHRHDTVGGYEVRQGSCMMRFTYSLPPVSLVGPEVWCHAVLLAYWQYGPDKFLEAPFLGSLWRALQ